ncbi:MAG TPA: hypothetical protein VK916_00095 [Gillisia sp.]|nr:hypothetical protein [Gillisia sp.]
MTTLQNFTGIKEGNLMNRRSFLNLKETTRGTWFNRRRYDLK